MHPRNPSTRIVRAALYQTRFNRLRLIASLLTIGVAGVFVVGGCPLNQPPGIDGGPSDGSDVPNDGIGGASDSGGNGGSLHAADLAADAIQGVPVTVRIDLPSGAQVDVVAGPDHGELTSSSAGEDGVQFVYVPDDDYVGADRIAYVLRAGDAESNVGTVTIAVHPRVQFAVDEQPGSNGLTVRATASTVTGAPLPDATYSWSFDGVEDSGPMSTHGQRAYTFVGGGLHVVRLSILLSGLGAPIACQTTDRAAEYRVVIPPAISGRVVDPSGQPVAGVRIAAGPNGPSATTGTDGRYVLTVGLGWSGALTPGKTGYTFRPAERSFADVRTDLVNQDFTATSSGDEDNDGGDGGSGSGGEGGSGTQFVISGHVRSVLGQPLGNVVLTESVTGGSVYSDDTGFYAFGVPSGWSGTITPTSVGWSFDPLSRSFSNVNGDRADQDFDGTAVVVHIRGTVRDDSGQGIGGVTVATGDGRASDVTLADGTYELQLPSQWSGTVTPVHASYAFTPANRSYAALTGDVAGQDYTGAHTAIQISGRVRDAGGSGLADVVLTSSNGGGSARTDQNGDYVLGVPYRWSGNVTPSHADYAFSPASRSYSGLVSNVTNEDYAGTHHDVRISGQVRDGAGVGIPNVTVSASNGGGSDVTDQNGNYDLLVPYQWSGTVTPSRAAWTFAPSSRSYSSVSGDQSGQNFTGTHDPVRLGGYIRESGGQAVVGVVVTASNGGGSDTTDQNGYYELSLAYQWSGTVTPSLADWTFTPASRSYSALTGDRLSENYTGSHAPLRISGFVRDASSQPIAGVSVAANNGGGSDATDDTGYYELTVPWRWSGAVTPSRTDWSFAPASRSYSGLTGDQSNQDYTGTHAPVTISGYVRDGSGQGVIGVTAAANNGGGSDTTDNAGFYALSVPYGWSGTVTPSHAAYIFSPPSRSYSGVTSDRTNQDYTATLLQGPSISGAVALEPTVGARPPIGPVRLAFSGSGSWTGTDFQVVTDINGAYSQTVPDGWTGSVAASDPARTILNPSSRSYDAPVRNPLTDQNYTAWTPPIGIPAPDFGIREKHTMYAGATFDFGNGPEPYRDAGNGPYTHYVDNTHANATDNNNPFGTASRPRMTIPYGVPAGSVVEVHGGPYYNANLSNPLLFSGNGTATRPVFYRGPSAQSRPVIGYPDGERSIRIDGTYVIVENFNFDGAYVRWWRTCHHLSIRDCEVQNTSIHTGIAGTQWEQATRAHDVVVYNNRIHHCGDWQADYDQDAHGVVPATTWNTWVLDNEITYNSGDGVQAHHFGISGGQIWTHHIYVGRNHIHHNKQAGAWVKKGSDMVISQNLVHDQRPIGSSPSSPGPAFGGQYEHYRIWILFNEGYNCDVGVLFGDTTGDEIYVIGNVFHDIAHSNVPNWGWSRDNPEERGYGIVIRRGVRVFVYNNTVLNSEGGIAIAEIDIPNRAVQVRNNVVVDSETMYSFSFVTTQATMTRSDAQDNIFYYSGGAVKIRWYRYGDDYSLPAWMAAYPTQSAGCLEADPRLSDPANGDYTLAQGSPAIDAGQDVNAAAAYFQSLYGVDIACDRFGIGRPQRAATDMGAHERP